MGKNVTTLGNMGFIGGQNPGKANDRRRWQSRGRRSLRAPEEIDDRVNEAMLVLMLIRLAVNRLVRLRDGRNVDHDRRMRFSSNVLAVNVAERQDEM